MSKGLPRSLARLYRQTAALSLVFDPYEFGARGDGVSDDAAAIQAAIDAAAVEGGTVLFGEGTYLVKNRIILRSGVFLVSERWAIIKLANGINTSVIEGENYQTLTGTSSSSGISSWGIVGLTIDGNRDNNPAPGANAGHGVAVYGRDFVIERLRVLNTARRGLHCEYANGGVGVSPYNGNIHDLLTNNTGQEGWLNGVSDLHVDNVNVRNAGIAANNTYDAIYLTKNVRGANINVWNSAANKHRNSILVEADGTTLANVHIETGATSNLNINASMCSILGFLTYNVVGGYNIIVRGHRNSLTGSMYPGTFNTGAVGLQLGQNGDGPSANRIELTAISHTGGVVDFTNSAGHNLVDILCSQATGTVFLGTPQATDKAIIKARGGVAFKEMFGGQAQGAVVLGDGSVASAQSAAAIGNGNIASASNTLATGGLSRASLHGARAHSSGRFATTGDAQVFELQWYGQTTNATPTEIFLDGAALRAVLANNTSWAFEVVALGRQTNGAGVFHRRFLGTISRGANAASTAFNTAPVETSYNTPVGWDADIAADTGNGSLSVTVLGAAAQNINWVVHIRASQVQG